MLLTLTLGSPASVAVSRRGRAEDDVAGGGGDRVDPVVDWAVRDVVEADIKRGGDRCRCSVASTLRYMHWIVERDSGRDVVGLLEVELFSVEGTVDCRSFILALLVSVVWYIGVASNRVFFWICIEKFLSPI